MLIVLLVGVVASNSLNASRHKVNVTRVVLLSKSFGVDQPVLSVVVSNNGSISVQYIMVSLNGTALTPIQNIPSGATVHYMTHIPSSPTIIATHRYLLNISVTFADGFSSSTSALIPAG
jgi:hypothetical protein